MDSFIDYDNKPLFQYMDEQKVDICSCIAAANKENGGVIENVRKYPDKLFGIGYVNVHDMDRSLANLRRYAAEGIFRGIKMHPYVEDYVIDDPTLDLLYETCLDLDIPLLFLLNGLLPMYGCTMVQPIVDCISMLAALWLYRRILRQEGRVQ